MLCFSEKNEIEFLRKQRTSFSFITNDECDSQGYKMKFFCSFYNKKKKKGCKIL